MANTFHSSTTAERAALVQSYRGTQEYTRDDPNAQAVLDRAYQASLDRLAAQEAENTRDESFVLVDNPTEERAKIMAGAAKKFAIKFYNRASAASSSPRTKATFFYEAAIQYYEAAKEYCKVHGARYTSIAMDTKMLGDGMIDQAIIVNKQLSPTNTNDLEDLKTTSEEAKAEAEKAIIDKKAQKQPTTDQTGGFGKTIRSRSRKHNKNKKRTSNKKRASKKRS